MQAITRRKGLILVALIAICALFALGMASVQGNAASKIKCKSVNLNATAVTLSQGDVATLQAKLTPTNSTCTVSWKSNNKKVATVTKTGTITAVAEGTATIKARTSNKKTASCVVAVKKYLTQDEALSLVKSNVLGEDEIAELIKESTLSEDDIKQLVKDNTLTEIQVKAIASQHASQGGVSESQVETIVKRLTGQSWEDGTELTFYNKEDLKDMVFECPYDDYDDSKANLTAKVKSIAITKKRTSEKYKGTKQLFEYDVHIEGTYEGEETDLTNCFISIDLLRSDGSANRSCCSFGLRDEDDIQTITASNGEFVLDTKIYNTFTDYDMFSIYPEN